jgi:cellulose biosynthesis protein BcsQ
MTKIIAFYNNKGGVGKTTVTSHFCDKLTLSHKVLLVDLDSQLNLSSFYLKRVAHLNLTDANVHTYWGQNQSIANILNDDSNTILVKWYRRMLSRPAANELEVMQVSENLGLIPGDPRVFMIAERLSGAFYSSVIDEVRMRSIRSLLLAIGEHHGFDYVLVDLSPSADIVNQNVLMLSDYWILPSNYDNYSMLTYKNLAMWAVDWKARHSYAHGDNFKAPVQLLGIATSRFSTYGGQAAAYFRQYEAQIAQFRDQFVGVLLAESMCAPHANLYYCNIKEYKQLMVAFNICNKASYNLTNADLARAGLKVTIAEGSTYGDHKKELDELYTEFAREILLRMPGNDAEDIQLD